MKLVPGPSQLLLCLTPDWVNAQQFAADEHYSHRRELLSNCSGFANPLGLVNKVIDRGKAPGMPQNFS